MVKRVLIYQGSGAEIMYPDLYKGLVLKQEDLDKYETPLVGFDGNVVMPKRQISLPVITEGKEVMMNFIMVHAFSPYTAILGRPWIHTMGAVPSMLHTKVKFLTKDRVVVVKGN